MKDCLIVSILSKNDSFYASYYIDALVRGGYTYDILYFERMQPWQPEANEIIFYRKCPPVGGGKLKKIVPMLHYARFIRKTLKRGGYKCVVVLTTVPAMCLADILLRDYRGKFILDIRDYSYEKNKLYSRVLKRIIDASYCVSLSSRGFLSFLPESDRYIITHNIPESFSAQERDGFKDREIYRIGFVGSIRYFDENVALIEKLKDAKKYRLSYFGAQAGGCPLQEYCAEHDISGVTFYGRYDNDKKAQLYADVDIVNSVYGTKSLETTTLTPNRLYDAAIYGCPIISSKDTYLAQVIDQYRMGFSVDVFHDDIPAALDRYIETFDQAEFAAGCRRLLADVEKDMKIVTASIDAFFKSSISGG